MHDIAIVGGGLCGLALLRLLSGSGLDVVLFEARARLGGRVLSVPARGGHPGGDLGPGWYWPDTQPLLNGLITELGLRTFAQHDQGISLYVGGPDQPPASLGERPVHDGARRIDGGMGRIIEGLAHALPPARLQTGCRLHRLRDHGDHVELGFTDTAFGRTVRARHVVLALPPRLIDETLAFEPALPAELRAAMRDTPTWMAAQAKLLAACEQPVWRVFGCSGNAFVRHAQAVVGEVFDACDAAGTVQTHFCDPIGHVQVSGDYVESWQPQAMSPLALARAREIAGAVTANLGGRGLFGVELFVKGDDVWFSEVSPRPHDTGLVTLCSQRFSEFELHARAILGLPVDVSRAEPGASAVIYGGMEAAGIAFEGVAEALAVPRTDIRLFGKPEAFVKRRMGVVVANGADTDEARSRAKLAAGKVRPVQG